jgi:hypothetical protein
MSNSNKIIGFAVVSIILLSAIGCTCGVSNGYIYNNCSSNLPLCTPVYDDLAVSMINAKVPVANAPTWRDYLQTQVPAFSSSQVNVLYFSAQLPHSYKEGTNLEFHIHLVYPDSNGKNSVWYFSYSWANIGDDFPAPTTTTVGIPSPANADNHRLSEIVASIDGTGKTISSVLLCSIQRLGNDLEDTYDNEIYLISSDFHFQADTLGSSAMLAK